MKNRAYNDIEALAMKIDSGDSGDTGDFTIAHINFTSYIDPEAESSDIDPLVIFGAFHDVDPANKDYFFPGTQIVFGEETDIEVIVAKNGPTYLWADDNNHMFDIRVLSGEAEVEEDTGPDGLTEGWTIKISGDAELVFTIRFG